MARRAAKYSSTSIFLMRAIAAPFVLFMSSAAFIRSTEGSERLRRWDLSIPDVELMQVAKQPIEIRDPQDQNDDNQAVQDRFDLSLHGDKPIHNPQQKTYCNERDDDGGKRHIVFSNHFSNSVPHGVVEKLRAFDSLSVGAIRKWRTISPLHFYSPQSLGKLLSHSAHSIRRRKRYEG
jgi:hypothetical protein